MRRSGASATTADSQTSGVVGAGPVSARPEAAHGPAAPEGGLADSSTLEDRVLKGRGGGG